MAEIHVRSDSVDVEQIMRQIRSRIREKRGVDYTEAEVQQLASVKLEKFLDPRGVRSDLVEEFRKHRIVSAEPPKYTFEDTTLYDTHRGVLRTIRRLLHPILKLFINPNPLIHAMHVQAQVNAEFHRRFRQREEMDPLLYELIHNLVVELTRTGIEVHNLKMRVESLSSRMDFDERRTRSLEGAVQYHPDRPAQPPRHVQQHQPQPPPASAPTPAQPQQAAPGPARQPAAPRPDAAGGGDGSGRRRRRRRRRRPGQTMGDAQQQGDWNRGSGNNRPENGSQPQSTADNSFETSEGPEDTDAPDGPDSPDQ